MLASVACNASGGSGQDASGLTMHDSRCRRPVSSPIELFTRLVSRAASRVEVFIFPLRLDVQFESDFGSQSLSVYHRQETPITVPTLHGQRCHPRPIELVRETSGGTKERCASPLRGGVVHFPQLSFVVGLH